MSRPRAKPANPEHRDQPDEIDDTAPVEPGVYIVRERPSSSGTRLLLPLVLILAACGVLAWRVNVADWHWPGSRPAAKLAPEFAAAIPAAPKAEARAEDPKAKDTAPSEAPKAEAPVVVDAAKPGQDKPAVAKPADRADGALAMNDLEAEAERIRNEKAELEKLKEQAGEEIAKAPPKPGFPFAPFGFFGPMVPGQAGGDALDRQRQQMFDQMEAIQRQFLADAEAHRRQLRGRMGGGFPPPPGFAPGPGDDMVARQMEELARGQRQMMEEMQRMMRQGPGGGFLAPPPGFGAFPPPPPQGGGDGAGGDANDPPPGRMQEFDILDGQGRKIGTGRRWEFRQGVFR